MYFSKELIKCYPSYGNTYPRICLSQSSPFLLFYVFHQVLSAVEYIPVILSDTPSLSWPPWPLPSPQSSSYPPEIMQWLDCTLNPGPSSITLAPVIFLNHTSGRGTLPPKNIYCSSVLPSHLEAP